jgi:hypothetical protein
MKNIYFLSFFCLFALGCEKSEKIKLNFLDEYVITDGIQFKNTTIGGLSGIDYANGLYYLVVDDAENPRFLTSKIAIKNDTISRIDFVSVIQLNDTATSFYKENVLDLESVFVDKKTKELNFTSEGFINGAKNPSIFTTDSLGKFLRSFKIPAMFLANSKQQPRHNATFEGSSKSADGKGFWMAMEAPLTADGEAPTMNLKNAPVRITYFEDQTKQATKQFVYPLENITKPAKGTINLNGVTALLEYKKNTFFVVERTYQNGYGPYGNVVRIFKATIDEKSSDVLRQESLRDEKFIFLSKELLFDFEWVTDQLTEGIIDNIEGITLGPKLSNGNESLILVADDNFQSFGKQLNQFILLEIKKDE